MCEYGNIRLRAISSLEKVRYAIFSLVGSSASGSDGLISDLFQPCWNILCNDILLVVQSFSRGHTLFNFITYTNLVVLPKMSCI